MAGTKPGKCEAGQDPGQAQKTCAGEGTIPIERDGVTKMLCWRHAAMAMNKALAKPVKTGYANCGQRPNQSARDAFLYLYSLTGHIMQSCAMAGINYKTFKDWKKDPIFAEEFAEAEEHVKIALEDTLHFLATQGAPEPIFYKGKQIEDEHGNPVFIHRISERLLETSLRAHIPEKYTPRQAIDINKLSSEQLLIALAAAESGAGETDT